MRVGGGNTDPDLAGTFSSGPVTALVNAIVSAVHTYGFAGVDISDAGQL